MGDELVGGQERTARERGGVWRVLAATAAFALVHSALASRPAKAVVRRVAGDRRFDAWYRPFYNAQAVATFAALVAYARRQPSRPLYEVRGAPAALMRGGQLATLAYAAWAVGVVGVGPFAGVPGAAAWARGAPVLPPPLEAQGPEVVEATGAVRAHGPFATSRHPLNFAFCALVWLEPRMTTTLAAFQALATLHLLAGSWHEESRLAARFGAPYEAYRRSGVPFFVPGWASEELSAPARAGSSSTGRSRLSALGEPQL